MKMVLPPNKIAADEERHDKDNGINDTAAEQLFVTSEVGTIFVKS